MKKKVSQDQGSDSKQTCNISCQYKELHVRDKAILQQSYLHSGISYTEKMIIRALGSNQGTNYIIKTLFLFLIFIFFQHGGVCMFFNMEEYPS